MNAGTQMQETLYKKKLAEWALEVGTKKNEETDKEEEDEQAEEEEGEDEEEDE